MRARTIAARASASLFLLFATLLLLPLGQGCTGTCSTAADCSGSDFCLFSPGSGCNATGHCGQHEPCVAQQEPIPLCSCTYGVPLNLFCYPSGGLTEPTTAGACPMGDAGASSTGDAGESSDAEGGLPGDAGGSSDARGQ